MKPSALILAGFLATGLVGGCAAGGGGSYSLGPGVASYDALATATAKCHADGGEVKLKGGYDQHDLSSYQCRIGGAK